MFWFALVLYFLIIALGVGLLWVAYQVAFRRRYSLIRGSNQKPLVEAETIAGQFSLMAALGGLAVLSLVAAIPLFAIRFGTWHFYLAAIAGVFGAWRQLLLMAYNRRRTLTIRPSGSPSIPN